MTMHPRLRSALGFTLLEVMIVLTVLGIVASVVIPSIASRQEPFAAAEQARRIHTEVSRLRAKAIAEQREYTLAVAESGASVRVRHVGDGETVIDRDETMAEGATATLNGSTSGTITFYPNGRVSETGVLEIEDGSRVHTVRILASGMTRWEVLAVD